jgi:DNA-binding CsgD family transcriptional regulator
MISKKERISMSDDISEKLETLIKLQAVALTAPMESSKEKIIFLSRAGLRPTLIAEIVGTTPNHVNVTLSSARKATGTKKRKANGNE